MDRCARYAMKRRQSTARPVRRRLMAPLAVVLLLLVGGFGGIFVTQQKDSLNQSSRQVTKEASADLARLLAQQSAALDALGQVIVREAGGPEYSQEAGAVGRGGGQRNRGGQGAGNNPLRPGANGRADAR